MADVQTLIDRNLEFASSFDQGDLTILLSVANSLSDLVSD